MESTVEIETTYKKNVLLGVLLCSVLTIRIVRFGLPASWEHIVYSLPLLLIGYETVKKKLYKIILDDKSITIVFNVFFISKSKIFLWDEIEIHADDFTSTWQGKRKRLVIQQGEQIIEKVSLATFKDENRSHLLEEIDLRRSNLKNF